jgi:hypothetical protein
MSAGKYTPEVERAIIVGFANTKSQREIAANAGIDEQTLSDWLRGGHPRYARIRAARDRARAARDSAPAAPPKAAALKPNPARPVVYEGRERDTRPTLRPATLHEVRAFAARALDELPKGQKWPQIPAWPQLRAAVHTLDAAERDALVLQLLAEVHKRADDEAGLGWGPVDGHRDRRAARAAGEA